MLFYSGLGDAAEQLVYLVSQRDIVLSCLPNICPTIGNRKVSNDVFRDQDHWLQPAIWSFIRGQGVAEVV
nr:hypothetical protein BV87_16435 [Sphingobium yanoikuyae]